MACEHRSPNDSECPEDGLLVLFAGGACDAEQRRLLHEHLDRCAKCRMVVAALLRSEPSAADSRAVTLTQAVEPASGEQMPCRGTRIGRYEVLEWLGAGGMGVVMAAYDRQLDRRVALKLFHGFGDGAENRRGQERLLREARTMARVRHPNVVAVFDAGMHLGRAFVVMEFIDGKTLRQWLAESPRSWRDVIRVYALAGAGLAAAHRVGVIHSDFKPDNVLLSREGRVGVADFGLARSIGHSSLDARGPAAPSSAGATPAWLTSQRTETRQAAGTPAYMAPEQMRGEPVDHRADQFSFCVALFEALYGRRPFEGKTVQELNAAIAQQRVLDPAPNPVPRWLRSLLLRGLSANPGSRFASMEALLAGLCRDTSARSRTLLFGLAALAIAAGASFWAMSRGARDCRAFEKRRYSLWNAPIRERTRQALLATGRPEAARAFDQLDNSIESFLRNWSRMRQEVCEASRKRGEPSEQLELEARCLDSKLEVLRALVHRFEEGDPELVDQAIPIVERLPDLELCADRERLGRAEAVARRAGEEEPKSSGPSSAMAQGTGRGSGALEPSEQGDHLARAALPAPERQTSATPKNAPRAPSTARHEETPSSSRGSLSVNCVPWCKIYVDGHDTGRISPALAMPLAAGRHFVRVVHSPSGLEATREILINPHENTKLIIYL